MLLSPAAFADNGDESAVLAEDEYPYAADSLMLKLAPEFDAAQLESAGVASLSYIMQSDEGAWYEAAVAEGCEVCAVMAAVRELDCVLLAEYNYIYESEGKLLDAVSVSSDVSANEYVMNAPQVRSCGVQSAWSYQTRKNLAAAGEGAVVAVIDTGVDYEHEDLRDSMWINTAEIPGNGIDDDGNGYIDDYYGVNIVTGEGSGMDDSGHGTHVAGTIAAANNTVGIVGIAYNAKIMNIKAGTAKSSDSQLLPGSFEQTDIVRALLYAYENGADVINMSFGGAVLTNLLQETLKLAATRCVLVAAAGNSASANEGDNASPCYPAGYDYVIGVMSAGISGTESSFTNFDMTADNSVEYEVYALGESVVSTIPNNKYTASSGTSMAAATVSAIAAMLIADYPDRKLYTPQLISEAIVQSGTNTVSCCDRTNHGRHSLPCSPNAYSAILKAKELADSHTHSYVNGVCACGAKAAPVFSDVAAGSYYFDAVEWAYKHEPMITGGVDKQHFLPAGVCTRAQIVTFLWRACGCPEPSAEMCSFRDVPRTAYYHKAVLWAMENGITGGYNAHTFGSNDTVTRAQAMTFLWRSAGQPEPQSSYCRFTDVAEAAYYRAAVLWAVGKGITDGYNQSFFGADDGCTRAQIVTFLYRYMK